MNSNSGNISGFQIADASFSAETGLAGADEKYALLQYRVAELEVEKIWSSFEAAGFAPILIKGWAAAQLYPKPFRRAFADIDLIISPGVYEKANDFAKTLRSHLPVDLHCGARHLDNLPFEDLYSNSIMITCNRTKIRVLRPEDHLRILCVHWLNDGGADREKLWDIYYAVARRTELFDWERLLETVGARRRRWIVCALGLAHKYLGLSLESVPCAEEAKQLPGWLIRAIEREWSSEVRLLPLHFFLNDKKMLWKQIKKRIPPNPIQATVELEGEFDDKTRLGYQLRDIFLRAKPAVKRMREKFYPS